MQCVEGVYLQSVCLWSCYSRQAFYKHQQPIDIYSRKIVSFHLSDNMRFDSSIVALQKALGQRSMAERTSGILKIELIAESYSDIQKATQHPTRCIMAYTFRRV